MGHWGAGPRVGPRKSGREACEVASLRRAHPDTRTGRGMATEQDNSRGAAARPAPASRGHGDVAAETAILSPEACRRLAPSRPAVPWEGQQRTCITAAPPARGARDRGRGSQQGPAAGDAAEHRHLCDAEGGDPGSRQAEERHGHAAHGGAHLDYGAGAGATRQRGRGEAEGLRQPRDQPRQRLEGRRGPGLRERRRVPKVLQEGPAA